MPDGDTSILDATLTSALRASSPEFSGQGDESDVAWRVFYTQQHGDNVTYEITAIR